MKKRLKFTNRTIHNWKSDFSPGPKSKSGKPKVRVYTPFYMDKTTQFRGLNLCEYKKGEKHFVIFFYIKGQRTQPRAFTLGKFDNNLNVATGETKFGIKQCQERLFNIAKEHQDEYGHWIKDPNLTVSFTQVNESISIRKLIEEYAKAGFEKMFNAEKMKGNSIRDKVRHLFGYNLRVRHLEYDTDDKGDGKKTNFDIVHSSATIEHLGSFQNQINFINECMRTSKYQIFITTPNRFYPIDFHTKLPFLHWLPKKIHRKILKSFRQKIYN